jgi:hypothetical protein
MLFLLSFYVRIPKGFYPSYPAISAVAIKDNNHQHAFVACSIFANNRNPVGLLQPLPIPKWKWEVVTMDFIKVLPRTNKKHDSIMVVVDKLTKSTCFIPLKTTHKATYVVDIYMREVARLHGIPKTIVSDRDTKFTSKFWKGLFKGFKKNLNFNTTYHPESDG